MLTTAIAVIKYAAEEYAAMGHVTCSACLDAPVITGFITHVS